jgi:hypothetical protein
LVDRSTRHLRQKQPTEKKLAILNRFFIPVPPTLQRRHKSIPKKVKPFGWLAQCLLFQLEQLITAEEFAGASPFLQTFAILQCTCSVSKGFTLAVGLALYRQRSEADSTVFSLHKSNRLSRIKKSGG